MALIEMDLKQKRKRLAKSNLHACYVYPQIIRHFAALSE